MKANIISRPAETSILEEEDDEVEDIAVVLLEEIVLFFLLDDHTKTKESQEHIRTGNQNL